MSTYGWSIEGCCLKADSHEDAKQKVKDMLGITGDPDIDVWEEQ